MCNGQLSEKKENGKERIFKEIRPRNFPYLMKDINLHIEEVKLQKGYRARNQDT